MFGVRRKPVSKSTHGWKTLPCFKRTRINLRNIKPLSLLLAWVRFPFALLFTFVQRGTFPGGAFVAFVVSVLRVRI